MSQQIRHIWPQVGIKQEDNGNHGHEKPDDPAGGLHQQDKGNDAHDHIRLYPVSLPFDDFIKFCPDICPDGKGKEYQHPVNDHVNIRPVRRCPFYRRDDGKGEDHDEHEMDRTLEYGCQRRDARGIKLEKGKPHCDNRNEKSGKSNVLTFKRLCFFFL